MDNLWKWFGTCVVFLSLLFTVTNFVPVSVGYAVLVPALPFLLYRAYRQKQLTPLHIWLLITYAYFAFCTLRYDAGSFLDAAFYRRDGSFFPLFIPILLCSLMEWKIAPIKMLKAFTLFASALNLLLLLWFTLSPATYPLTSWDALYYSLFESHSAAGGFLLCLGSCALGLLISEPNRKWVWGVALGVALWALIMAGSRGSVMGLAAIAVAILWLLLKDRGLFKKSRFLANIDIYAFLALLLAFMLCVGVVYQALAPIDNVYESWKQNTQYYAPLPTKLQTPEAARKLGWLMSDGITRSGTVIDRLFYLWPRAMDLFIKSPVIGMGTGSYDDTETIGQLSEYITLKRYAFTGQQGFAMKIVNDHVAHTAAHAHNSYLQVMAENGIIGLLLMLMLCYQMRKAILALPNRAMRVSLYSCLVGILIAAFFENRFFAPAQMLPFVLLLGIALSEKGSAGVRTEPEGGVKP
ncbi:MAG: O-antigen ligase family protein [Eubacteriales bacterium]|nr:O-antigen ligase family protein [Eubacteriales bacterium]